MSAQRVTLQPVTHHPIQPLETLAHVGSSRPPNRSASPRQSRTLLTASPAHSPIAPASAHQSRRQLQSCGPSRQPPPEHGSCPVLVTDSPRLAPLRPEHRRQHLRSQLPLVSSDNDSECSAQLRACGRTHSASSRSVQTLPPTAGSPMNCDGDGVPDSALRSCHHFITTARNKTGALLSRLRSICSFVTIMYMSKKSRALGFRLPLCGTQASAGKLRAAFQQQSSQACKRR